MTFHLQHSWTPTASSQSSLGQRPRTWVRIETVSAESAIQGFDVHLIRAFSACVFIENTIPGALPQASMNRAFGAAGAVL